MRQITSAAVVLAALAACTALASCGKDQPSARTAKEPPSSAAQSPSEPGPDPGFESEYSILPDEESGHLEHGRWALRNPDGPAPLAVIDIPENFGGGGGIIYTGDESFIGYWLVSRVFEDPCEGIVSTPVGATVEDLAAAVVAQKVTTATKPVPVSVDGHKGLYVELTAPVDLDYDSCRMKRLTIWVTPKGGWRWIEEPGVDRYWILDVDGQRVVLLTAVTAGADKATVELLSNMVEATTFVDPD